MATLTLKVKTKDAEHIVGDLTAATTIDQLKRKLAAVTNIRPDCLNVLLGFPPKKLDLSDVSLTLEASGIRNGVKLIVEETTPPPAAAAVVQQQQQSPLRNSAAAAAESYAEEIINDGITPGILLKKVVPSDNSCLFTSIGKFGALMTLLSVSFFQ